MTSRATDEHPHRHQSECPVDCHKNRPEDHNKVCNSQPALMQKEKMVPAKAKTRRTSCKHQQHKGRAKRPEHLPKRPLTAYNYFFKEQRELIVEERTQIMRAQHRGVISRHKKGKVAFEDLARLISARWKVISPTELERFKRMAEEDSQRYKREMGALQQQPPSSSKQATAKTHQWSRQQGQQGEHRPSSMPDLHTTQHPAQIVTCPQHPYGFAPAAVDVMTVASKLSPPPASLMASAPRKHLLHRNTSCPTPVSCLSEQQQQQRQQQQQQEVYRSAVEAAATAASRVLGHSVLPPAIHISFFGDAASQLAGSCGGRSGTGIPAPEQVEPRVSFSCKVLPQQEQQCRGLHQSGLQQHPFHHHHHHHHPALHAVSPWRTLQGIGKPPLGPTQQQHVGTAIPESTRLGGGQQQHYLAQPQIQRLQPQTGAFCGPSLSCDVSTQKSSRPKSHTPPLHTTTVMETVDVNEQQKEEAPKPGEPKPGSESEDGDIIILDCDDQDDDIDQAVRAAATLQGQQSTKDEENDKEDVMDEDLIALCDNWMTEHHDDGTAAANTSTNPLFEPLLGEEAEGDEEANHDAPRMAETQTSPEPVVKRPATECQSTSLVTLLDRSVVAAASPNTAPAEDLSWMEPRPIAPNKTTE